MRGLSGRRERAVLVWLVCSGSLVRNGIRDAGRGHVGLDLLNLNKGFLLYSKRDGKPLEGFQQGNGMTCFTF